MFAFVDVEVEVLPELLFEDGVKELELPLDEELDPEVDCEEL